VLRGATQQGAGALAVGIYSITDAERRLWSMLRGQKIDNARFAVKCRSALDR
jgi:hypothetical protein